MRRGIWIPLAAILATSTPLHAQQDCDAVLAVKNITSLVTSSRLAMHLMNAYSSNDYKNAGIDINVPVANVPVNGKGFSEQKSNMHKQTDFSYSQQDSLALLQIETPRENVEAWLRCKQGNHLTDSSFFVKVDGQADGLSFSAVAYWQPSSLQGPVQLSDVQHNLTIPGVKVEGLPTTLKIGSNPFRITRNSNLVPILGVVSGSVGAVRIDAGINIPRWSNPQPYVWEKSRDPISRPLTFGSCAGKGEQVVICNKETLGQKIYIAPNSEVTYKPTYQGYFVDIENSFRARVAGTAKCGNDVTRNVSTAVYECKSH